MCTCVAAPSSTGAGVERNGDFEKLSAGYLFPRIAKMRKEHLEKYPDAKVCVEKYENYA